MTLVDELRARQEKYPDLPTVSGGALCGRAADEIERLTLILAERQSSPAPSDEDMHGEWDKLSQRYADGCRSGASAHEVRWVDPAPSGMTSEALTSLDVRCEKCGGPGGVHDPACVVHPMDYGRIAGPSALAEAKHVESVLWTAYKRASEKASRADEVAAWIARTLDLPLYNPPCSDVAEQQVADFKSIQRMLAKGVHQDMRQQLVAEGRLAAFPAVGQAEPWQPDTRTLRWAAANLLRFSAASALRTEADRLDAARNQGEGQ